MPPELESKVAIVTGGERGIGRATVLLLAERGCRVLAAGVDEAALAGLAKDTASGPLAIKEVRADVSCAAQVQAMVVAAVEAFGGLDILVNNAAVAATGPVETISDEEWDRVIGVNLKGAFLAAKYAIPEMRRRGGGAIVNVSSLHAFATTAGRGVYAASKTGLIGLTRAMALDHAAEGIRVNAVCPGAIDTPMLRGAWPELAPERQPEALMRELAERHPVKRVGRPEEVAEMIAFLCSPRSSFITGAEFKVEGGVVAQLSTAPQGPAPLRPTAATEVREADRRAR